MRDRVGDLARQRGAIAPERARAAFDVVAAEARPRRQQQRRAVVAAPARRLERIKRAAARDRNRWTCGLRARALAEFRAYIARSPCIAKLSETNLSQLADAHCRRPVLPRDRGAARRQRRHGDPLDQTLRPRSAGARAGLKPELRGALVAGAPRRRRRRPRRRRDSASARAPPRGLPAPRSRSAPPRRGALACWRRCATAARRARPPPRRASAPPRPSRWARAAGLSPSPRQAARAARRRGESGGGDGGGHERRGRGRGFRAQRGGDGENRPQPPPRAGAPGPAQAPVRGARLRPVVPQGRGAADVPVATAIRWARSAVAEFGGEPGAGKS